MKLTESVVATLTYSDHFDFPLTVDELRSRLIATPISRTSLIRHIGLMLKAGSLARTSSYYHLPGRRSLVYRRRRLEKIAAPQLTRAGVLAERLGSLPGVKAVYLTGSLALKNAPNGSDIDFMIITYNDRLWTTRFLLTVYCSLFGLRRTPYSRNNSGKLCLNLFLSPISYTLSPIQRSLYTAYELVQAAPLYDPQNTHADLLAANPWIRAFLPNIILPVAPTRVKPPPNDKGLTLALFIEKIMYYLQLAYMRPKITREIVTPNSAFFHPRNPGKAVLRRLKIGELYNSMKIEN